MPKHNSRLTEYSQNLRKNMTDEEQHIWFDFLKQLPYALYRQKIIGDYIVDFYCARVKTVIEIDGSQHYDDEGRQKDMRRDMYLGSLGIKVLRYTNVDINTNFKGVCEDILKNFGLI